MTRSLVLVLALLSARTAPAQLEAGDIVINGYGSTGNTSIGHYRPDMTHVRTITHGTGWNWQGAGVTANGEIVVSRWYPTPGVNVFGTDGVEQISFAAPGLTYTADVSVFADGTLAVSGQTAGRIDLFGVDGTSKGAIASPTLKLAFGTYVDENDHLWVADVDVAGANSGRILRFDRGGTLLASVTLNWEPSDMIRAPDGTLWVTDRQQGRVRHLTENLAEIGSFTASGTGSYQTGIAMANDGTLLVTAFYESVVRRFDTNGNSLGVHALTNPGAPMFLTVVPSLIWSDQGIGIAGSNGAPRLDGTGNLDPGTPVFLELSQALPGASSVLVIGASAINAPLLGGLLVPSLDVVLVGLPVGPSGGFIFAGTWPGGVPSGTSIHFQSWIPDPVAPQGWSASRGLQATQP